MMLVLSRKHLESILVTSFTFAAFLFALPREYKEDGGGAGGTSSPVPTVVYNTIPPSTFHLFVFSLIFAFSFSLSALLIHDSSSPDHNSTTRNKTSGNSHQHLVVNLFGCSSLASIATALAILFRAILLTRAILFRALLLTATEAYYPSSPSSAPTTVLCRSCSNAGAVCIGSGDYVVQLGAVQLPARPCRHRSDDRRRSLATTMIAVVILMAAVISTVNAGCTRPQGTNGSLEVLIPGHQSSIPSDVLTTAPSVTADCAPLDVVDSGDLDDDSCGAGHYQATAAGIHQNDCIAEFPPYHVDVPAVTDSISNSTDQIRTEERVEDNDEKDSFKFGNKMALMVSSFQPRGNLSLLATWSRSWSPSWSTSSPPPTSSWSSSASFPVTVARLAVLFGFAARLIGRMMLRRGHRTAANFFRHAGYFSGAVAFFSMTYMFVPDHLAWAVLAAAGVLALVFAYSLGGRL